MSFSFFRDLRGGAGVIRAGQIADHLGGRVNPAADYDDDVCIYLLGSHRRDGAEVRRAYYDLMDCGPARLGRIARRTKGDLIAISTAQYMELKRLFPHRAIYYVPQHHCNFARELRPARPVKTVGTIGGDSAIQWPHDRVKAMLAALGFEWRFTNEYMRRGRVVDFYKDLDVQIVWRPTHQRGPEMMAHMNPLKLNNAGSFGIPSVAFPEPAFAMEWGKDFLHADSINSLLAQVVQLRDNPALYQEMSSRALLRAEGYHIDKVAQYYRDLPC